MKAVVLAAGKGSRLGRATDGRPKPMLPVGGRPLIGYLLNLLARNGVGEVFVNLHHQPKVLKDYCGDGRRWGLRITYAVEPELLGTAGAVRNFADHLGDSPFFVVYGDNYLDCDLAELWAFHQRQPSLATLALFEKSDVTGSGIVELDAEGRVSRFVEKPGPADVFSHLVNGGLYVLSPAVLPLIPNRVPCDFGYDVFPVLLAVGRPVFGMVMAGTVWPIDTPELYRTLCERMDREPA